MCDVRCGFGWFWGQRIWKRQRYMVFRKKRQRNMRFLSKLNVLDQKCVSLEKKTYWYLRFLFFFFDTFWTKTYWYRHHKLISIRVWKLQTVVPSAALMVSRFQLILQMVSICRWVRNWAEREGQRIWHEQIELVLKLSTDRNKAGWVTSVRREFE